MHNSLKIASFGAVLIALAFAAMPSLAQTVYPSYYTNPSYPTFTQTQPQYYTQPAQYGSCPALSYNLVAGSSDYTTAGQVSQLQTFLRNRYGDARLTGGYYGSLTTYYVTRFQQEQGVYPATGGIGPLTRQAIQRVCGGSSYYPTPAPTYPAYPTYPTYPTQNNTTFRLNSNFSLSQNQTGVLSNGTLTVLLNQLVSPYSYYSNNEPDAAVVTLGLGCNPGTQCFYYPTQTYTLQEGDDVEFQGYDVTLKSLSSSKATFRVTDDGNTNNDNNDANITVTAPRSGLDVEQGDTMRIAWDTSDEPSNASVQLDLYEDGGRLVGTIAVSSDTDGSYSWNVPERNTICPQIYPNGLCGADLDGDYYIKASLMQGQGFSGGAVLDTATSGTFTVDR